MPRPDDEEAREFTQKKKEVREQMKDSQENLEMFKMDGNWLPNAISSREYAENVVGQVAKLGRDVLDQFQQRLDEAQRDAKLRKEAYSNPMTRPSAGSEPVHFTINIDSKVKWVDSAEWHRCHDKNCPENF